MTDVSFTVKTKSGPTYRSKPLTENVENYVKQLMNAVKTKDEPNISGSISFFTEKNAYLVIPLSDVAHLGIHDMPAEWIN